MSGFTLLELLVVIAIIALLAALIGPQVIGELGKSRVETTRMQVRMLATALDSFHLDVGRYPSTEEGLAALVEKPVNLETWGGPYLRERRMPTDGWGNAFLYQKPASRGGVNYDIYSLGADGQLGGDGDNADVGNW